MKLPATRRALWFWWLLANAAGFSVLGWLGEIIPEGGGAWLLGVPVGVSQWIVLRREFGVRFLPWTGVTWGASLVALLVGGILGVLSSLPFGWGEGRVVAHIAGGAAGGAAFGFFQEKLLRRYRIMARTWVYANAVAFAVGVPVTLLRSPGSPSAAAGAGAALGIIVGGVTGAALIYGFYSQEPKV